MSDLDEKNVYESGLNLDDWHRLARAFVSVGYREEISDLPVHLVNHNITILIRNAADTALSDDKRKDFLNEAGCLLVPINPKMAGSIVMKSV